MDRKLMELSVEKSVTILSALKAQDSSSVSEYVKTIHSVETVLKRLLGTKKLVKVDLKELDNIHVILTEYENRIHVHKEKGADKLKKALESSRHRKRIDQINASLFSHLRQFLSLLKDLNAPSGKILKKTGGGESPCDVKNRKKKKKKKDRKKKKSKGKKAKKDVRGDDDDHADDDAPSAKHKRHHDRSSTDIRVMKEKTEQPSNNASKCRREEPSSDGKVDSESTSEALTEDGGLVASPSGATVLQVDSESSSESSEDDEYVSFVPPSLSMSEEDAKSLDPWWNEAFCSSYIVPIDELLNTLAKEIGVPEIDPEDANMLRAVIDNSKTGHIGATKWAEFLKAFGPIDMLFSNLRSVLSAPWFYSFLSGTEAERILSDRAVGTFLIRFSKSSPGNFALAFVHAPKVVVQILISGVPEGGFSVLQQETGEYKHFATLWDIVDCYHAYLKTPLEDNLLNEPWFHGNLSSAEATELLRLELPGVFLIRWSSHPDCYACSYVDDDGAVHHSLIEKQGGGRVKFANNTDIFASLEDLLVAYENILQQPYVSKSPGVEELSRIKASQEER